MSACDFSGAPEFTTRDRWRNIGLIDYWALAIDKCRIAGRAGATVLNCAEPTDVLLGIEWLPAPPDERHK